MDDFVVGATAQNLTNLRGFQALDPSNPSAYAGSHPTTTERTSAFDSRCTLLTACNTSLSEHVLVVSVS